MPGGIAENAAFICGRWNGLLDSAGLRGSVSTRPEIGLCFFEAAASLGYDERDLPLGLAGLPCSWHIHLPVDLPLCSQSDPSRGQVEESFGVCRKLMRKCEFLGIDRAVLHPPSNLFSGTYPDSPLGSSPDSSPDFSLPGPSKSGSAAARDALELFAELWARQGFSASGLLLENQPGDDPDKILQAVRNCGIGLCFDFAHVYMGESLPSPSTQTVPGTQPAQPAQPSQAESWLQFAVSASLWHINAPGLRVDGHASLTQLSPAEKWFYLRIFKELKQLSGRPTLMLELFKWADIEASLPLLWELPRC